MAELPDFLLPHRVAVEPYLGDSAVNDTFGPKVPLIRCRQEGELLVTAEGERKGNVKLYLRLDQLARFVPESRVTLRDGSTLAYVRAVAEHSDGGAGGWEHIEVSVS